jgi:hypothetical protein
MSESEPTFSELGNNSPCYCGSGLKFKRCHGREQYERKQEQKRQEQQERLATAVRQQVDAGWRLESKSEDRAVVSRRRFGLFAQRKLIAVTRYGEVSIGRL